MMNSTEIEIDEDGDGELADVLVCVRLTQPLMFPDNKIAICDQCGEPIQHRPHVPKRPLKLCWECVEPTLAKGQTLIITPTTAVELAAYFKKKSAN